MKSTPSPFRFRIAWLLVFAACAGWSPAWAQTAGPRTGDAPRIAPGAEELTLTPSKVVVNPVARDDEIRERLKRVLVATDWFIEPDVVVEEGVVFLRGRVETTELKQWAGDLARNTEDVVAVANQMEVIEPAVWDLGPGWRGLLDLWRDFVRSIPFLLFGLLTLGVSAAMGVATVRMGQAVLREHIQARLLRNVVAVACGVLVFLIGTYIVLRVSGLTQLALTVVGGTGLLGLAVGIAFRDITENFLASIFLSIQRPFETGDLIEVTGVTGYVQQLNVRVTILMTLEGNLVQIPNSTIYKNNVCNFTTSANRRGSFLVGIGYDDSIDEAQRIARALLAEHPAVLKDPEPSVLVENLGKATVELRVFFWLNGREHSLAKVRSSVIRLLKRAYQQNGIWMPDEAREVVFPNGVPVTIVEGKGTGKGTSAAATPATPTTAAKTVKTREERVSQAGEIVEVSTQAEGGLSSEAGVIEEQARRGRPLPEADNLLPPPPKRADAETRVPSPDGEKAGA